jgi:hypothetical protein
MGLNMPLRIAAPDLTCGKTNPTIPSCRRAFCMSGERFWRWYDRGARADFAGTLLGYIFDWKGWIAGVVAGGGGGMTFLKAAIDGRSLASDAMTASASTPALGPFLLDRDCF